MIDRLRSPSIVPCSFYRGDYEDGKWNEEYWKLKEEFVGVVAPVERTEADLDPPTIFHIAQDFDMIRSPLLKNLYIFLLKF